MSRWSFRFLTAAAVVGLAAAALTPMANGVTAPPASHGTPAVQFPGVVLNGISAAASDDVWAVGTLAGKKVGVIEHWDGTSWSRTRVACHCTLEAVNAQASDDAWAVGQGDQAVLEHWDGTSWTATAAPALDTPEVFARQR